MAAEPLPQVQSPIVVVISNKGGVGKSTFAVEIAAVLGAVLVDCDWDAGNATSAICSGPRNDPRLLDALLTDRVPRPLRLPGRPLLIPGNPNLAANEYDASVVADRLTSWASAYGQPLVVDTHPGATSLTYAALAAANAVLVPVPLRQVELVALGPFLEEFASEYPLILAPNMVPAHPPRRQLEQLEALAERHRVPVAPPVSEHRWLTRRLIHRAITQVTNPGAATARAAREFSDVAVYVLDYLLEAGHAR